MGMINAAPIANVFACELITNEATRRIFTFTGAKSVTPEPVISEGREEELRARNTILAQNILEDILKGYDIKLKDVVFSSELMEVIQGGASGGGNVYSAPSLGGDTKHTRFILRLYSEYKDCDGSTSCIYRFTFPECFGSKAAFSLEDGEFTTPEYTIRSRAKKGHSPLVIDCMDSAPVYLESASDYPLSPEQGVEYIAMTAMTVGGYSLEAGDALVYDGGQTEKLTPAQ